MQVNVKVFTIMLELCAILQLSWVYLHACTENVSPDPLLQVIRTLHIVIHHLIPVSYPYVTSRLCVGAILLIHDICH
jgi:hypothetical protein